MKILLISEFFPLTANGDFTGGVETRTFFVARELAKKHQVTVLCSYTGGKRLEKMAGFLIIRVGPRRKHTTNLDSTRILYAIAAIWRGKNIIVDVVEGTNFINQLIAYCIGKLQKIPIVAWTPDVWKGQWKKNMGFIASITGSLIEDFNLSHRDIKYIAISETVARKIYRVGVPQNLITVIPCGVDYLLAQKIRMEKKLIPIITVVCRLVKYKSIDVLLRAFALLAKNEQTCILQIIGQGPEKKNLQKLAHQLKIKNRVNFIGFIQKHTDVLKKLKESYIFCLPSETEGFGIVTIEAMAVGLPVVLADIPINREVTRTNGAVFFKPADYHDLAKKLHAILINRKRYKLLSKSAQQQAKKYDWKDIAKKTEKLYENLCTN